MKLSDLAKECAYEPNLPGRENATLRNMLMTGDGGSSEPIRSAIAISTLLVVDQLSRIADSLDYLAGKKPGKK